MLNYLKLIDWGWICGTALVLTVFLLIAGPSPSYQEPQHSSVTEQRGDGEKEHYAAIEAASAFVVALFTIGLVWSTVSLRDATKKIGEDANAAAETTRKHFAVAERAYVKLSHHAPGIVFDDPFMDGGARLHVRIAVKNWGKTPAVVSDVVMDFWAGKKAHPQVMIPDNAKTAVAFLVPGEEITVSFGFSFDAAESYWIQGALGTGRLTGHVDYIDRFGGRWRSGYDRTYHAAFEDKSLPVTERNNLLISFDCKGNYDRPRANDEGIDLNWKNI